MKYQGKPFLIEDREFPLECSISYGVEPEYRMLHWHQEMEINWILRGTGKQVINGNIYPCEAGDIFLINNDEIHMCYDDVGLEMMVLMFDPTLLWNSSSHLRDYAYLQPFFSCSGAFQNRIDGNEPEAERLRQILEEVQEEYTNEASGYQLMIKSLLMQFLTWIIRNYFSKQQPEKGLSVRAAGKVEAVMQYLDEHYAEPISLEALAAAQKINRSYLCSIFRTMTAVTPMEYLIRRRIGAAKQLLVETEENVLTISEQCGFGSLSNFNHQFKALTGCSPRVYRNLKREG